jgi:hypothetical protein
MSIQADTKKLKIYSTSVDDRLFVPCALCLEIWGHPIR